jgi:uroporphyrinogen III methyltransferase/synthase
VNVSTRQKPLSGKHIVVTRSHAQAGELVRQLEALGARAISLPTIEVGPPKDWTPLDRAIDALATYDGLIFTSANGVEALWDRAASRHVRLERGRGQWICAIGPATAEALGRRGWRVDILPASYVAESVVDSLEHQELRGKRILLPRAAVARDVIPRALTAAGARVDVVEAYRTRIPEGAETVATRLFPLNQRAEVDAVLFTSSSTAENFTRVLGSDYRERLKGVALAAIGPITAATLKDLGLNVSVIADEFTATGLLHALIDHFAMAGQ